MLRFLVNFIGVFFLAGTIAGYSTISSQNHNEPLRGSVADKNGDAVPGATIYIEELDTGVAADGSGNFDFGPVSSGSYTLTIRSLGYITKSKEIEHPDDGFILIELLPAIFRADDVIVTSSPIGKNIQYQPAQALNREVLQQKAAPSLGEILDGAPGITTRSFGSAPSRPVIRGFDGDRVLVLQNGERMGDLSATAVDHAVALDPLSMDRVEVVRGPASLLYGSSAIGGVINMFSNDMPQEWESGINSTIATHVATVNNMGAGLMRSQYGGENFAATGRIIYRNGGDLKTPEGRLPDTSINNISYGSGAGYRFGSFETGLSISGLNYTYGLPEAIDDPNKSIEIRMNRINFQSISTLKLDSFFDHAELRLHYSDYDHDEVEIGKIEYGLTDEELEIRFNQQTISSSLVLRHKPVGALEGAIGFSFNHSQIAVTGTEALTPDASGYSIAAYIYEEIGLNNALNLKTGLRVELKETFVKTNELFPDADAFEDRSDLIYSGSIGLNFSPSSRWNAGIQVARAYRTPNIEELYSFAPHAAAGSFDVGNPMLQNEFSIGSDAFIEYQTDKLQTQFSLFTNRIENYVDFSPTGEIHEPSGLPVFEYTSKDAAIYGFEFTTNLVFSRSLKSEVTFEYVRGHERTGRQDNLTFMPPFRTHLQFMYDKGSLWAGSRLRMVNSQNKVAPNENATPGYLLIGADAGYRFGNGFTLSLRLDNLLNEGYRDHLSRVENRDAPMPGRNLNAMLRWEF